MWPEIYWLCAVRTSNPRPVGNDRLEPAQLTGVDPAVDEGLRDVAEACVGAAGVPAQDGERRPWTNFGGNQTFEALVHPPQNDEQVPDHLHVGAAPGVQSRELGVDAQHEAVLAVDGFLTDPRGAGEEVSRRLWVQALQHVTGTD